MAKKYKRSEVEKIVNYLNEKKTKAEVRLKEYQGPVMATELRNSPHMQHEQTRLIATVELLEDVIMAINQFCEVDSEKPIGKNVPEKKKR